jgi:hypothetical protein
MSEEQFDGYRCAVRIRLRVRKHGKVSKKSASSKKSNRRSKKSNTQPSTSESSTELEQCSRSFCQELENLDYKINDSKSPFSEVSSLPSKSSSYPTSMTGNFNVFNLTIITYLFV